MTAAERQLGRHWLAVARQALHHGHARTCTVCAPAAAHAATSAALSRATTGGAR